MSVSVRPGSRARNVRTKVKKGFCDFSFLVAGAHLYRFIFVLQLHVMSASSKAFVMLEEVTEITARLMT